MNLFDSDGSQKHFLGLLCFCLCSALLENVFFERESFLLYLFDCASNRKYAQKETIGMKCDNAPQLKGYQCSFLRSLIIVMGNQ